MAKELNEDKKARRNARIARCRFLKNLFIWFLGVIFIPVVMVVTTMFIPLKLFTGSDGSMVSEELSEKSLFNVATTVMSSPEKYGVKDFPVILNEIDDLMNTTVFNDTKISDLISVDKDKLKEVTFGENVGGSIIDCFKVTATIDSVGITDSLGDFGKLSVFKEYSPVDEEVNPGAADFNYKLYYYKVEGENYAPAFEKNGETITKVSGEADLYYPNLIYVPMPDMADIFSDRMGTLTIKSLLNTFGVSEDSDVMEIFGEKTLKELSGFDFNDVKLSIFLDTTTNKDMYDILCAAVEGDVTAATITIGNLNDGLDIYKIKLSTFIDIEGNEDLYDVLCAAVVNDVTAETITLGDLRDGLSLGKVKISAFMGIEDHEDLYNVLCSAIDGTTPETLTVDDLSTLSVDNIKIAEFLGTDSKLLDVLCKAIGGDAQPATLTTGDLKTLNVDNIKLTSVIDPDEKDQNDKLVNKAFYDVLWDTLSWKPNIDTIYDIALSDLSNFDTYKVRLATILEPSPDNASLYKILCDFTNTAEEDKEQITLNDIKAFKINDIKLCNILDVDDAPKLYDILRDVTNSDSNDDIKLSDLNNFSTNKIKLTSVLTYNETENGKLYTILEDVTGKANNEIKLSDLDEFATGKIKLAHVIDDDGGNTLLKSLLDKDVTVDEIAGELNNLSLYEVYGKKAFSTTPIVGARRFNAVKDEEENITGYTANASGKYYMDTNAGVWLVLCYDVSEYDEDTGEAKTFVISDATVNSLNNGTNISAKFKTATIRHLIDAGILEEEHPGDYASIYKYTLPSAAERLVELLALAP